MDKLPGSLIDALKNNEIIPVVAAGVSMSIRDKQGNRIFPSWEELLLKAADKLKLENDIPNATLVTTFLEMKNYKEAAKYAYTGLKGPLWKAFIEEQFKPKLDNLDASSASLPKAIWKLSNQIITLNYDRILQWSHSIPSEVTSLTNKAKANLPDMFKPSSDPIVWHLHGHIDNTAELILTPDSYANFYGDGDSVMSDYKGALEALKIMITTRSLLFIGCSLDDADLLLKIHQQQKMFAGNIKPHYALVKASEKIEIEQKLNGTQIKLITFENFGQPMLDKLSEMHKHVTSEKEAKVTPYKDSVLVKIDEAPPKFAYLSANPLGFDYDYQPLATIFKKLPFEIDAFSLTEDNLNALDGYDYIFIATKVVKNKLVIEDEFHCFDKNTFCELEANLGREKRKGIFIFVDKLPTDDQLADIKLPTLILPALDFDKHKKTLLKFYFQVFKNQNIGFYNDIGISCNEECFDFNNTKLKNSKYILHKNMSKLPKTIDPRTINGFVGRKEDLERLSQTISNLEDDNGFLTIKGTGGLGKTRLIKQLTIAFADRGKYEDGIEFIDCEPILDFQQFKYRIASIFNLEQAQDLEEHLNKLAHNKSYLIILDNFETLLHIDDKEKIISLLSFMCDFATIVVTSREFLKLDGEIEYTLRQMTLDEAFYLFSTRMNSRNFNTEETKLVRDELIDKLLDRNPLAIKILADNTPHNKNISVLIDELENDLFNKISEEDLKLFDNATDVHIDRKKSIYGSILYSYKMLSESEKEAFEKLSLFPDGIDLENFKRLTLGGNKKAIFSDRVIKSLQNKSLLESNNTQIKLQSIVARL
ncbi:SIR2 family protein [Psychromonas hadalis]|uniref:SIR2 family protein n=1 Tax=Psychromonas hadalis TaxID=211669 RepID=UPI0003B649D7|nr:SIR2 family protein [Psychromonas hadalis]